MSLVMFRVLGPKFQGSAFTKTWEKSPYNPYLFWHICNASTLTSLVN